MGQALPGDRPGLAPGLGARGSVLRLCSRRPQDDLHHQRGRGVEPQLAQDHQDPGQLSQRRPGVEAVLPPRQDRRLAWAASHRLDRRHGPVRHSVRLALSGIGTMTKVMQTGAKTTEPPVSISRLIRWTEFGRSAISVKAGLRLPPSAAAALTELAARPLLATMGSTAMSG